MENMQFEKALEKLEDIVAKLEEGNLTLDESMKAYEEGVKLAKVCHRRLNEVEKKVEVLVKKTDDTFETEDFIEGKETKKKKTKSRSKKVKIEDVDDEEEELLFS